MPLVNLSAGPVHYTEAGQGTPIVLLHANPGDSRDFEEIIPKLSKKFQVLALDWPGYGQSALPKQLELVNGLFFSKVLREFIKALDLPPAFFIGNSLGGSTAARLACESPELVRGLVLVSPGGFLSHNFMSRAFCKLQASRLSISPHRFASLYLRKRTATTKTMLQRASSSQATSESRSLNRAIWRKRSNWTSRIST